MVFRYFAALLIVGGLIAAPAIEACSTADHVHSEGSTWKVDDFYAPGTSNPMNVKFDVTDVESGTTVEVFDGTDWVDASAGGEISGSRFRISVSGSATVSYLAGGCEEEIYTSAQND